MIISKRPGSSNSLGARSEDSGYHGNCVDSSSVALSGNDGAIDRSRRQWLHQAARQVAGAGALGALGTWGALTTGGVLGASWAPRAMAGSRLSPAPAPPLRLPVEGQPGTFQTLEALAGRVVLLNFWATWCVPCRREFPALDALAVELAPAGLTTLAINVEDSDADAEVAAYLAKARPGFQVLRDADMAVARAYRIPGMPATMLVDRKGQLRWQHAGYEPGDENQYRQQARLLLAEPAPTSAAPAA